MKHLKSSLRDLRRIFERSITVREIAEPFTSFDAARAAIDVKGFMRGKEYSVVGVRKDGLTAGYVRQTDLGAGTLEAYMRAFDDQPLLPENAPLLRGLEELGGRPWFFVTVMDQVSGIATRGDLQKAPVRMWLFGLISLLEMQFLRLIRGHYPDEQWRSLVAEARIAQAETILKDRRRRDEVIDLADCLQFADKRTIVAKSDVLRSKLGYDSKNKFDEMLKELENLRNELAHAQDVIVGRWPSIVELAGAAEGLLKRAEEVTFSASTP